VIIAAGLTPAWQQVMVFDRIEAGEVNRAREVAWCASGKVLNVGIALVHLGARARTIAPLGGAGGEAIAAEFHTLGALAHWIVTETPTRVCTTLLDQSTGATTELVENQQPWPDSDLAAFSEAFRESAQKVDLVVLSGSLPPGTPTSF
jgi:fructose-1-phosphate kinase PfkB-like protein